MQSKIFSMLYQFNFHVNFNALSPLCVILFSLQTWSGARRNGIINFALKNRTPSPVSALANSAAWSKAGWSVDSSDCMTWVQVQPVLWPRCCVLYKTLYNSLLGSFEQEANFLPGRSQRSTKAPAKLLSLQNWIRIWQKESDTVTCSNCSI